MNFARITLAAHPDYRGTIAGPRFDPESEGEEMRVEFISWKAE